MSTTIGHVSQPAARSGIAGVAAVLRSAIGWPARVYRARRLLERMGRFSDHELSDIGLLRHDLHDALGSVFDTDPSWLLRQRADERRRRR